MIAKKIMDTNITTCSPFDDISHVYNLMHQNKTDHIVVVNDKQQPVGLISYRDMTFFKLAMVSNSGGITRTKIKDLMVPKPWCVYEDASIESIIELVTSKSINSAPVVDYDVKLKGIILKNSILLCIREFLRSDLVCVNNLKKDHFIKVKAGDMMTKDPVFCKPDDTAINVDKIMARYHIGHLPVVKDAEHKEVVGVISFKDLTIMALNKSSEKNIRGKIKNFMSKKLWLVEAKETLDNIIMLMVEKNIGSLPVVENMENKKLIGIICRRDVYMTLKKFEI